MRASLLGRGSCPKPARFQPNLLSLPPAPSPAPAAFRSFGNVWLPPASSHAGQPCATGTWVLLQRVRRRLGGAGRLAAPSGLQALLPPAASHCPGRPRALIRPGAGMGARPWGRAGTAAGLAPGSQQPGDGHRAGHQQLLDFRAGLTETLPALWFVYFFFFFLFYCLVYCRQCRRSCRGF